MGRNEKPSDDELVALIDAAHAAAGAAQLQMLRLIAKVDERESWIDLGAGSAAHWVSMRYDVSVWKASRWIAAGHALAGLPSLCLALEEGRLGLDKCVELCRFATSGTEARLIRWAAGVNTAAVRSRGDREARAFVTKEREVEENRFFDHWFFGEERRMGFHGELPAAQGAVVIKALSRLAGKVPSMPGEARREAKMADALVALCSSKIAEDPDPDRATVVIHAQLEGLSRGTHGCELEDANPISPHVVRRLLCNARVQTILEDASGNVLGMDRTRREPPAWMLRQVRYRDRGCRFPGCGRKAFTEAHHVRWWRFGGKTELQNLLLLCSFHHKLVHELGWTIEHRPDGEVHWFDPEGVRYRAGPSRGSPTDVHEDDAAGERPLLEAAG